MASPTTQKGQRAEEIAVSYLEDHGYQILERNFRCRSGEIDIIACEGDVLCFVEVRSTRSNAFGDPLETIDAAKRRRIIRTAQYFISGAARRYEALPDEIRFDVVGITLEPELKIRLVRGAFETSASW